MSPLWRDQVYIALAPDRLVLVRVSGGLAPKVLAKTIVPVLAVPPEGGWKPALDTLAKVQKANRQWQDAKTSVVLSNYFVRYQLIAWSDEIETDEEREAYVRASFSQVYGEGIADWAYSVSETGRGASWLAAAIDRPLLTQLDQAIGNSRSKLVSVMPHLMPAFNAARREIKCSDAWFVQVENKKLLLGLILGGHWQSIGSRQVSDEAWQQELPVLLDREWRLKGMGNSPRTVYVSAPEAKQAALEGGDKWVFHWLRPKLKYGFAGRTDDAYAMAVGA
ncbi:MAG: hypothetical protein HZA59_03205 [Hydrogenophilales bacterium]|nr:hypothetical protein [Hydrogenophilales bacterium]